MTREKTRISRNRDPYPLEGHAEPGKASISAARPWRRAERTRSERGYGLQFLVRNLIVLVLHSHHLIIYDAIFIV